ncbi:MAG TPA: hypothetical protein VE688_08840 [Gaiellaceae bacterium]|jgi:hypothetical protein|nr:hypothetical protein [Gaiellaceae bacterium]
MRFAFLLTGMLALAVALPSVGVAAQPIVNEHSTFSDTFPDEICGIPGTSTINAVDNFKLYADGTFLDTSRFNLVFTADASGRQVRIFSAGQVTGLDEPIDNGDGTITFINTFKGLPEKLSIQNGPTLLRDAGTVTIVRTFFVEPNGDLTLVSQTLLGEHGPHPDLDSDFEAFCNVLVPALT